MIVLLCGTTGLCKSQVARQLIATAESELGPHLRQELGSRSWVKHYCVEDEIRSLGDSDLQPFLDSHHADTQREAWREAMDRLIDKIEKEKPKHAIVSLHLVFHRDGYLFSVVDWDFLARLRPSVVVTLIDDVYDCEGRLRRTAFPPGRLPSWQELLLWRSAEINAADQISRNLYLDPTYYGLNKVNRLPKSIRSIVKRRIPHFLVAVKHPVQTLYRLLFRRSILPVYASFPITRTRKGDDSRKEIDSFRRTLHENFATLDPLAIDERRVSIERQQGLDITIRPFQRWPMQVEPMVPGCDNLDESKTVSGITETFHILDEHIRFRDYALVDGVRQARGAVVAYRPFWGKDSIAGGVDKEITYAIARLVKVFAVDNPLQDKERQALARSYPGPLDMEKVYTHAPSIEKLINEFILPHADERRVRLKNETEDETWE